MALNVAITLLSELWLDVPGPSTNRELIEALQKRGHRVSLITNPADSQAGDDFDLLIPRWIWQGASLPPAVAASLMIEQHGARSINSVASMITATDKRLSNILFDQAGIDTPLAYDGHQGNWICKPAIGSMANNIVTGSDPVLIDALLRDAPEPYIVQERIEEGAIWRVITSPEKLLASYSWLPSEENFSPINGKYNFDPAPTKVVEMAQAMVEAVDGDIMGCDIIEDQSGKLYALEVNGSFGLIPFEGRMTEAWVDMIEEEA